MEPGLKLLKGYPADVVAVEVVGHVTKADYEDRLTRGGKGHRTRGQGEDPLPRGRGFRDYSPAAAWEDMTLGLMHLTKFAGVALVTDVPWLAAATRLFAPLVPCPVRVFPLAALDEAKGWISGR
ncbi:MAG: STAS/SEC14 domain-containing protein [Exiguobacterium profundum]|nr:MAG: STAS/SEC14 domain-containing protein [Exiguobacterium profundum]